MIPHMEGPLMEDMPATRIAATITALLACIAAFLPWERTISGTSNGLDNGAGYAVLAFAITIGVTTVLFSTTDVRRHSGGVLLIYGALILVATFGATGDPASGLVLARIAALTLLALGVAMLVAPRRKQLA